MYVNETRRVVRCDQRGLFFSLGSSAAWSESPLSAIKIAELNWSVQHGLGAVCAGRSGCSLHAHLLMYASQRPGSNDRTIKFATSAPLRLSFFLSFLLSFSFFLFLFSQYSYIYRFMQATVAVSPLLYVLFLFNSSYVNVYVTWEK